MVGVTVQVLLERAESLASERSVSLFGLKGEIVKLKKSLEKIKVSSFDFRCHDGIEYFFDYADDVLDEIHYEILRLKVDASVGHVKKAFKVKGFRKKLIELNEMADGVLKFPPSLRERDQGYVVGSWRETVDIRTPDQFFVGRDEVFHRIIDMLISPSQIVKPFVLSIVGMKGLGKTCLARQVYDATHIGDHFGLKIWICVSQEFNVQKIIKCMLEAAGFKNNPQEDILKQLRGELKGKKCLLVLDDLRDVDFQLWEKFMRDLEGINICILVTTCLGEVANAAVHQTIFLEKLTDASCWRMIRDRAFGTGEVPADIENIGKEIANKCKGIPLAALLVGGALRNQEKETWLSILKSERFGSGTHEQIIYQSLELRYDSIRSSSLRRCFLLCSVFPRDYTLFREEMIQIWMAEGLLNCQGENRKIEDKGTEIFDNLVKDSLLQDVEMDMYGNIRSCMMRDFVHNFAKSTWSFRALAFVKFTRTFHVRAFAKFIQNFPVHASRTLVLRNEIPADMMHFGLLRALILIGDNIRALPNSIGKLNHLRYLDLSKSGISQLPKSVCKLYFLQTLRLPYVKKLPSEIKKLGRLQHLYFASFLESTEFPRHIGQLTRLQMLNFFNLTPGGCQIKELGCLKNLGGELVIKNLQLVRDIEEAQMADLKNKSNLYELKYFWNHDGVEISENHDESVLDGLEPPPRLKCLNIVNYLGTRFPTSLPLNLVELKFHNCRRCREVPSLGQLDLLRRLELVGLHAVEYIGSTLYGVNGSGSDSLIQVFPALEKLVLDDMPRLIEWKDIQLTPTTNGGGFDGRKFPKLRELSISKCPLLITTPSHFEVLRVLRIEGVDSANPVLDICRNSTTLVEVIIKDVKELTCRPDEILKKEDILRHLKEVSCPKYSPDDIPSSMSVPLSDLGMFSKYMDLRLEMLAGSYSNRMQNQAQSSSYHNLVSEEDSYQLLQIKRASAIPEHLIFNESIAGLTEPPPENVWREAVVMIMTDNHLSVLPTSPNCPHLLLLFLQRSKYLRSIPHSFFTNMPCLHVLDLSNTKLKFFPSSLFNLKELQVLILRNCHSIYEIPEHQIGALTSLEVLDFSGTELHNLPPGIGELTRLKHLHLSFYGADDEREASSLPDGLFSKDIIAKLPDLRALSFGVHPEDKRWSRDAGQIIEDINRLQNLRYLQFYFPTMTLLEMFIDMSHSWKNNLFTRFKLVVGQNVKRVVDRVSQREEHKYEKHDRCLRFVNGEEISNSVLNLLKRATAFYLDHHTTISTVSQFELTGSEDLKFLLLRECPNIQVLVENEGRSEPVMPALEHLGIHYLWRLENICRKYSLPSGSFSALKSLMIDTCPKLKFLFDYSILQNVSTLENLIVRDCVLLKEMVKLTGEVVQVEILPRLKILQLSYLPQLVLQSMWMDPAPDGSFCSLKSLTVNACQNVEFIFSHSVLQKLSNLEELVIESCLLLKQIIETAQFTIEFQVLPRLKVLKLSYLPELVSLNVWMSSLPKGSFGVLTSVIVKACSELEFIFPQSMLHYLSNLEELAIEDCKALKEVVEETEEEQVMYEDHGSALCSLKELKLRHLPELVSKSSIPHVEKPDIVACPKLKDVKFEELSDQV